MAKRWFQSVDLEVDEQGQPVFESALVALAALIAEGRLKVSLNAPIEADIVQADMDQVTGSAPLAKNLYELWDSLTFGGLVGLDAIDDTLASVLAALSDTGGPTFTTGEWLFELATGNSGLSPLVDSGSGLTVAAALIDATFGRGVADLLVNQSAGLPIADALFESYSGWGIADLLFDQFSSSSVADLLGRGPGSGYTISQLLEDVAIALNPLGGAYRDGSGWGENSSFRVVSGEGAGAEKVATDWTLQQVADSLIGGPGSNTLAEMFIGPGYPSTSYESDMEPGDMLAGGLFGGPYGTSVARKLTAYGPYVMDVDLGDFLAEALCATGTGARLADLLASSVGVSAAEHLYGVDMGTSYVVDALTAHGPSMGLADFLVAMLANTGEAGDSPFFAPGPGVGLGQYLQGMFSNSEPYPSPFYGGVEPAPIGVFLDFLALNSNYGYGNSPLYTAGGAKLADLLYSQGASQSVADLLYQPYLAMPVSDMLSNAMGGVADHAYNGLHSAWSGTWLPDMLENAEGDTVVSLLANGKACSKSDWPALTAPGTTASYQLPIGARDHVLAVTVANINTDVTVRLEGSIDNANWFPLAADLVITANGTQAIIVSQTVPAYVRGRFVSETGGTAATVTFKYRGTR